MFNKELIGKATPFPVSRFTLSKMEKSSGSDGLGIIFEILIRALESENEEVAATAHRELKRITKQDLPANVEAGRRWLKSEEKNAKSSELPSTDGE